LSGDDLDEFRDIEADIDMYRVKFFRYMPGVFVRYGDVDDMPFDIWDECRQEIDRIEGR
jgi:hypothetical protein